MPKEELKGPGDERRVVVHDELEEDAEEGFSACAVQVEVRELFFVAEDLLGFVDEAHEGALVDCAGVLFVGFFEDGEKIGEAVVQAYV